MTKKCEKVDVFNFADDSRNNPAASSTEKERRSPQNLATKT